MRGNGYTPGYGKVKMKKCRTIHIFCKDLKKIELDGCVMHFCDYQLEGCYLMKEKKKPQLNIKKSIFSILINAVLNLLGNRKQKVTDVIIDEIEKEGEKIIDKVIK